MSEITYILKEYASFEIKVRENITKFYSQFCFSCSNICCKTEICKETEESIFLKILHKKYQPSARYSIESGWLAETGCTLLVGRPPVCYEFLCDHIIKAQPDIIYQYMTQVLSNLVSHIGKNALSKTHIVEIMSESKLQRINFSRFKKKLSEAESAFMSVHFYLKHNFLKSNSLQALSKILIPPLAFDQHMTI